MTLLHRHRTILIFLLLSLLMHGAGLLVLNHSRTPSSSEGGGAPVIRVEMVRIAENSPGEGAAVAAPAPPVAKKSAAPAHSQAKTPDSAIPPPELSAAGELPPAAGPIEKAPADPPEKLPARPAPPSLPDGPATERQPEEAVASGAPVAEKAGPPRSQMPPQPLPEVEEAVRVAKPPPGTTSPPVPPPKKIVVKEPVAVAEEASSAVRPQAPPALSSAQQRELLADYQHQVRALIARQKRYPLMARRRQLEGEVLVGFAINPDGSLAESAVVRSSGASLLDRAALDAVRSAGRFPPPPPFNSETRRLPVEVPIDFRLR